MKPAEWLLIQGARQNNLKNISLAIPHNRVTVITGVSGSGKSSLAFDTLFAEGQWRYIESLSTYARMFLERLDRPDVDSIQNIRPAVAIEQKNPVRSARSTVGTATEVYDYLRLLYAKVGTAHCLACGGEATSSSPEAAADELLGEFAGERALICFPLESRSRMSEALAADLLQRGFVRVKVGGEIIELGRAPLPPMDGASAAVVLDRVVLRAEGRSRLVDSLEMAFREGKGVASVEIPGRAVRSFGEEFRCRACGKPLERPQPFLFSFNHPLGACPECKGFGNILRYDENLIVPDRSKSLADGAVEIWKGPSSRWWFREMMKRARARKIDVQKPYEALSEAERRSIYEGDGKFTGIRGFFEEVEGYRYKLHVRVFLSRYRSQFPCPRCHGSRLKPQALAIRVGGLDIAQLCRQTIEAIHGWLADLPLTVFQAEVAKEILRQLSAKLTFLLRVGLGYLTLDRQTRTLSGGEAQRINLANQLGSQLVGTLYVLDEPSIGLHARDTSRLAELVGELARAGNTAVVVEHDRTFIEAADYLVELGPGSGERGGEVVFAGGRSEFLANQASLTARYLTGKEQIPLPILRREGNGTHLTLAGAREHNLKNLTVRIPLHTLTCITGVSGSGKSTLVHDTLYRALARAFRVEFERPGAYETLLGIAHVKGVRLIDQKPIGRTPRSNPVTYLKAFDEIRKLYASLPKARAQGLGPGHFSFNVPGGRCEACQGDGYQKLEMYFLEDVYVTCQECQGRRYRPDVLQVTYKGKNISQVLQMTVTEALGHFAHAPGLVRGLRILADVGLGYIRLGQPATTLSGGEAQRMKIAAELGHRMTQEYVYILDEPTTGLHLDDIKRLLLVLNRLVDAGNTVIVVEHHMDVIKQADWVIDLGPEGGEAGGELVAEGTPEQITQVEGSWTGKYLREVLNERLHGKLNGRGNGRDGQYARLGRHPVRRPRANPARAR